MTFIKEKKHIIEYCANSNTPSFNLLKVLEEMAEFQEVATKIETKHPNNPDKPKKEELVKEFGDLIYRGIVYLKQIMPETSLEEIEKLLEARINKKLSNFIARFLRTPNHKSQIKKKSYVRTTSQTKAKGNTKNRSNHWRCFKQNGNSYKST